MKNKLQNAKNKKYAAIKLLKIIEKNLPNLNKSIVSNLSNGFTDSQLVLDFGAGIGTLAQLWKNETGNQPECLEIDKRLHKILKQRNLKTYSDLTAIKKKYAVIYSSNVLEHIEDDLSALKKIHSKLHNNGFLCIFVPAFNCLYSELDASVGHYRRYSKKDLIKKLKLANFQIRKSYFFDSIGFIIWYLCIKLLKFDFTSNQSKRKDLSNYDKYIIPMTSFLDAIGLKFLFGKNLIVIAQKQ